ncbi:MAG: MFS transporter, partial [Candidatus Omnitrophica bacterium]|nr:MFS transporter [Candidatus Omnitrophota bacterium]
DFSDLEKIARKLKVKTEKLIGKLKNTHKRNLFLFYTKVKGKPLEEGIKSAPDFAYTLNFLCFYFKISPELLRKKLGFKHTTFCFWVEGKREPCCLDSILKLAKFFKVSPSILIEKLKDKQRKEKFLAELIEREAILEAARQLYLEDKPEIYYLFEGFYYSFSQLKDIQNLREVLSQLLKRAKYERWSERNLAYLKATALYCAEVLFPRLVAPLEDAIATLGRFNITLSELGRQDFVKQEEIKKKIKKVNEELGKIGWQITEMTRKEEVMEKGRKIIKYRVYAWLSVISPATMINNLLATVKIGKKLKDDMDYIFRGKPIKTSSPIKEVKIPFTIKSFPQLNTKEIILYRFEGNNFFSRIRKGYVKISEKIFASYKIETYTKVGGETNSSFKTNRTNFYRKFMIVNWYQTAISYCGIIEFAFLIIYAQPNSFSKRKDAAESTGIYIGFRDNSAFRAFDFNVNNWTIYILINFIWKDYLIHFQNRIERKSSGRGIDIQVGGVFGCLRLASSNNLAASYPIKGSPSDTTKYCPEKFSTNHPNLSLIQPSSSITLVLFFPVILATLYIKYTLKLKKSQEISQKSNFFRDSLGKENIAKKEKGQSGFSSSPLDKNVSGPVIDSDNFNKSLVFLDNLGNKSPPFENEINSTVRYSPFSKTTSPISKKFVSSPVNNVNNRTILKAFMNFIQSSSSLKLSIFTKYKKLHPYVFLFTAISLCGAISSEINRAILPLFTISLGGTGFIIGMIGALGDFMNCSFKLISGFWADKYNKERLFIILGYFISFVTFLFYPLSKDWMQILFLKIIERSGEGIRAPCRDALIGKLTPSNLKSQAFGLHRVYKFGGFLGVLLTFLLFSKLNFGFRPILVFSIIFGAISSLLTLRLRKLHFCRNNLNNNLKFLQTIKDTTFNLKKLILAFILFSLANFTRMFFILKAAQVLGIGISLLMYTLFNLVYAVFSYPAGIISDRIGKRRSLCLGYLGFSLSCLLFALFSHFWGIVLGFIGYGMSLAIVDSNQRGLVSDVIEKRLQNTGFGIFHTATGLSTLLASLGAGFLWEINPALPFGYGSLLSFFAGISMVSFIKKSDSSSHKKISAHSAGKIKTSSPIVTNEFLKEAGHILPASPCPVGKNYGKGFPLFLSVPRWKERILVEKGLLYLFRGWWGASCFFIAFQRGVAGGEWIPLSSGAWLAHPVSHNSEIHGMEKEEMSITSLGQSASPLLNLRRIFPVNKIQSRAESLEGSDLVCALYRNATGCGWWRALLGTGLYCSSPIKDVLFEKFFEGEMVWIPNLKKSEFSQIGLKLVDFKNRILWRWYKVNIYVQEIKESAGWIGFRDSILLDSIDLTDIWIKRFSYYSRPEIKFQRKGIGTTVYYFLGELAKLKGKKWVKTLEVLSSGIIGIYKEVFEDTEIKPVIFNIWFVIFGKAIQTKDERKWIPIYKINGKELLLWASGKEISKNKFLCIKSIRGIPKLNSIYRKIEEIGSKDKESSSPVKILGIGILKEGKIECFLIRRRFLKSLRASELRVLLEREILDLVGSLFKEVAVEDLIKFEEEKIKKMSPKLVVVSLKEEITEKFRRRNIEAHFYTTLTNILVKKIVRFLSCKIEFQSINSSSPIKRIWSFATNWEDKEGGIIRCTSTDRDKARKLGEIDFGQRQDDVSGYEVNKITIEKDCESFTDFIIFESIIQFVRRCPQISLYIDKKYLRLENPKKLDKIGFGTSGNEMCYKALTKEEILGILSNNGWNLSILGERFPSAWDLSQRCDVFEFLSTILINMNALHELGHLFGLDHCRNQCVMNQLLNVFGYQEFCSRCQKKLARRKSSSPVYGKEEKNERKRLFNIRVQIMNKSKEELEQIILREGIKPESEKNWILLTEGVARLNQLGLSDNQYIREKYQQNLHWCLEDEGRRDLHLHSVFTDGRKDLGGIINEAVKRVIKAISLTDHNCIEGVKPLMDIGKRYGIVVIPGVEISSFVKLKEASPPLEIHLLAYGFDPSNYQLNRMLKEITAIFIYEYLKCMVGLYKAVTKDTKQMFGRFERDYLGILERKINLYKKYNMEEKLSCLKKEFRLISDEDWERLNEIIKNIAYSESKEFNKDEATLFEKLALYQNQDGWSYLSDESFNFVPSSKQIIDIVHEAGGAIVLAHPHHYIGKIQSLLEIDEENARQKITNLTRRLISEGLDGIEVHRNWIEKEEADYWHKLAEENSLIITGGTDSHFEGNEEFGLGKEGSFYIDKRLLSQLLEEIRKRMVSSPLNICAQSRPKHNGEMLGKVIEFVKEDNVEGIEFFGFPEIIDYLRNLSLQKEILRLSKDGYWVQIHAPFPLQLTISGDRDVLKRTLDLSKEIKADVVTVHPEGDTKSFAQNLYPFVLRAEKYGVIIAVENIPESKTTPEITAEYMNDLFKHINIIHDSQKVIFKFRRLLLGQKETPIDIYQHIGICFDIGHANLLKGGAVEFLQRLDPKIKIFNVHVHDNNGKENQHLRVGRGNINFIEVFKELIRRGYDGRLVLEYWLDDPEEVLGDVQKVKKWWEIVKKEIASSVEISESSSPVSGEKNDKDRRLFNRNEFFPAQLNILENLSNEPFTDIFSFMKRDNCSPSVRVTKVDMASFLANGLKTEMFKNADNDCRFKRREVAHLPSSISCKPTNSKREIFGCSTSRQSWIASLIRFKSVGKVLACVWQAFKAGTVAISTLFSSLSIRTKKWFLGIFYLPDSDKKYITNHFESQALYYCVCLTSSSPVSGENKLMCGSNLNINSLISVDFDSSQQVFLNKSSSPVLLHEGWQHHEFYWWLKEKVENGEVKRGLSLIVFDYHSDASLLDEDKVTRRNFLTRLQRDGLVEDIYWVQPLWSNPFYPTEKETGVKYKNIIRNLKELSKIKDEVLVSIDYDYFSIADIRSGVFHILRSEPEAKRETRKVIDALFKNKSLKIVALDLTWTGTDFMYPGQAELIDKAIKFYLERLELILTLENTSSPVSKSLKLKDLSGNERPHQWAEFFDSGLKYLDDISKGLEDIRKGTKGVKGIKTVSLKERRERIEGVLIYSLGDFLKIENIENAGWNKGEDREYYGVAELLLEDLARRCIEGKYKGIRGVFISEEGEKFARNNGMIKLGGEYFLTLDTISAFLEYRKILNTDLDIIEKIEAYVKNIGASENRRLLPFLEEIFGLIKTKEILEFCKKYPVYLDKSVLKGELTFGEKARLIFVSKLVKYHLKAKILNPKSNSSSPVSEEEMEKVWFELPYYIRRLITQYLSMLGGDKEAEYELVKSVKEAIRGIKDPKRVTGKVQKVLDDYYDEIIICRVKEKLERLKGELDKTKPEISRVKYIYKMIRPIYRSIIIKALGEFGRCWGNLDEIGKIICWVKDSGLITSNSIIADINGYDGGVGFSMIALLNNVRVICFVNAGQLVKISEEVKRNVSDFLDTERINFRKGVILREDIAKFDLLYIYWHYWRKEAKEYLRDKLLKELKEGATIIVYNPESSVYELRKFFIGFKQIEVPQEIEKFTGIFRKSSSALFLDTSSPISRKKADNIGKNIECLKRLNQNSRESLLTLKSLSPRLIKEYITIDLFKEFVDLLKIEHQSMENYEFILNCLDLFIRSNRKIHREFITPELIIELIGAIRSWDSMVGWEYLYSYLKFSIEEKPEVITAQIIEELFHCRFHSNTFGYSELTLLNMCLEYKSLSDEFINNFIKEVIESIHIPEPNMELERIRDAKRAGRIIRPSLIPIDFDWINFDRSCKVLKRLSLLFPEKTKNFIDEEFLKKFINFVNFGLLVGAWSKFNDHMDFLKEVISLNPEKNKKFITADFIGDYLDFVIKANLPITGIFRCIKVDEISEFFSYLDYFLSLRLGVLKEVVTEECLRNLVMVFYTYTAIRYNYVSFYLELLNKIAPHINPGIIHSVLSELKDLENLGDLIKERGCFSLLKKYDVSRELIELLKPKNISILEKGAEMFSEGIKVLKEAMELDKENSSSSSSKGDWHLTEARMVFKREVINSLISQKGEIEDIEKEIIGRILTFPSGKGAKWKYRRFETTGLLRKEDIEVLYSLKAKEGVPQKVEEFDINSLYKKIKEEIEKMRKEKIEESDILNLLSRGYTLNYIKKIALKKRRDFREVIKYLRKKDERLRIARFEFEKRFNEPIRKGVIRPHSSYPNRAAIFRIGEVYFYLSLHYSKYAQDIKEGNFVYEYWWDKLIIRNKEAGEEWIFKINLDGYLLDLKGSIIEIKGETTDKFIGRKKQDLVTFNISKYIPGWQDKRLIEEERLKERIKNLWENASRRTPKSAELSLLRIERAICNLYPQLKNRPFERYSYIARIVGEKFLINYLKKRCSQAEIKEIFSIFFSKERELIAKEVILSLNSLDEKSCALILDMIRKVVGRKEKIENLKRELKNAFSRNLERYKEEILLKSVMRKISEEKRRIEELRKELENAFSKNLERYRKEELWKVGKKLYKEIKKSYKKSENLDDLGKVLSKISIEKILLCSEFLPKKAISKAYIHREYIEHLFGIIELITEERWEEAVVSVYNFIRIIETIFPSSLKEEHPLLFKLLPENIKERLPAEDMEEDRKAFIERSLLSFGILASSIEELKESLQSLCKPEKIYHLIKKAYINEPPDRIALNLMLALATEENCQQKFKSALEELFKEIPGSKNLIERIIDTCDILPYKVEYIFKQVLENKSSSPIFEFIKRKIRSPTIIILTILFLIIPSFSYSFSYRLSPSLTCQRVGIDLKNKIIFRFDDGPCRQTLKILSLLEKHKIKNAQFYFIGRNFSPSYITREVEEALRSDSKGKIKRVILKLAKENPRGFSAEKARIIKRIIEDGYTLGIHTFTHPIKDKLKKYSPLQFLLEVIATQQVINLSLEKIGEKPYFCRVFATPGGEKNLPPILREQLKNLYKPSHPLSVYRLLRIKSLKQIFPHISELDSVRLEILGGLNQAERWNIDSCDTKPDKKRLKSQKILKEIIKLSSHHQKIIILIHPFKGGWQKELKELFQLIKDRSSSSIFVACDNERYFSSSSVSGKENKGKNIDKVEMLKISRNFGLFDRILEVETEDQNNPNACLRSWSNSFWMAGLICPNRLRARLLWIVNNLLILKTESFLSPVEAKSGWFEGSRNSALPMGLVTIEEMKAIIISSPWGSGETITAGRTFALVKSVNGKGTRTISPRFRLIESDFFSIGRGIDIFFWIIQELKTGGFFSEFAYKQTGNFIFADGYSKEDPLVFGQLQGLKESKSSIFIDSWNQFGQFNSPPLLKFTIDLSRSQADISEENLISSSLVFGKSLYRKGGWQKELKELFQLIKDRSSSSLKREKDGKSELLKFYKTFTFVPYWQKLKEILLAVDKKLELIGERGEKLKGKCFSWADEFSKLIEKEKFVEKVEVRWLYINEILDFHFFVEIKFKGYPLIYALDRTVGYLSIYRIKNIPHSYLETLDEKGGFFGEAKFHPFNYFEVRKVDLFRMYKALGASSPFIGFRKSQDNIDEYKKFVQFINRLLGYPLSEGLTFGKLKAFKKKFERSEETFKETITHLCYAQFMYYLGLPPDISLIEEKEEKLKKKPLPLKEKFISALAIPNTLDLTFEFKENKEGEVELVKIHQHIGGKAINATKVIQRLGYRVNLCCVLSKKEVGRQFYHFLIEEEILPQKIYINEDIRVYPVFSIITKEGKREEFRFSSAGPEISDIEYRDILIKTFGFLSSVKEGSILIGGGRGLRNESGKYIWPDIIKMIRDMKLKIIFDFTLGLTPQEIEEIIFSHPFMIKPNLDEFAYIIGKRLNSGDIKLIAQETQKLAKEKGIEIVVVSLEEKGAVLATEDSAFYAQPPEVEAKSTVGCGDALIGGMALGLCLGKDLPDALRFGVSCGTVTATKEGTEVIKSIEEAEELQKKIKVYKIASSSLEEIGVSSPLSKKPLTLRKLKKYIEERKIEELVRFFEKQQREKVKEAVERIVNLLPRACVVIGGPSTAGRTTLSHMIIEGLKKRGLNAKRLDMGSFFKEKRLDFGLPDALDWRLINACIKDLLGGEIIRVPHFDMEKRRRTEKVTVLKLEEKEILLI